MGELHTNLKRIRVSMGLSQQALARLGGISRQAYAALESGASVPSTGVALRLARALRTRVESIFSLRDDASKMVHVQLLETSDADIVDDEETEIEAGPDNLGAACRVRLMQVGNRLLARRVVALNATIPSLVDADGVIHSSADVTGKVIVHSFDQWEVEWPTLVMLGCDPAMALVETALQREGVRLVWSEEGSYQALLGLSRGEAHIAGCHLRDNSTDHYNISWVRRLVPFPCTLVTFAVWQQGLIVDTGNPKRIYRVEDLVRPDVNMINRQLGSGSRSLLDMCLEKAKIPIVSVSGYEREAGGHVAVAMAVASGLADVGVGVEAVAAAMGLAMIPLRQERYDLVIPDHFLNEPVVQAFLDLLHRPALRRRIEALGGYDVALMGSQVSGE
jgi:putative molybdopterin biosynthesis protein